MLPSSAPFDRLRWTEWPCPELEAFEWLSKYSSLPSSSSPSSVVRFTGAPSRSSSSSDRASTPRLSSASMVISDACLSRLFLPLFLLEGCGMPSSSSLPLSLPLGLLPSLPLALPLALPSSSSSSSGSHILSKPILSSESEGHDGGSSWIENICLGSCIHKANNPTNSW